MGSALELELVLGADGVGYVDLNGEALDHARGGGGHLFFDGGGGSGDFEVEGAGLDTHDGEHAGAERGGDEVGGGEALAAALIVGGGVGAEFGGGGTVDCLAVEVSLIFNLDGDHGGSLAISLKIQQEMWVEERVALCFLCHRNSHRSDTLGTGGVLQRAIGMSPEEDVHGVYHAVSM